MLYLASNRSMPTFDKVDVFIFYLVFARTVSTVVKRHLREKFLLYR
jgi:hypothetical protein